MPRPKRRRTTDDDFDTPRRTRSVGSHVHVAELHGEAETLGLREWAKQAVLSGARSR